MEQEFSVERVQRCEPTATGPASPDRRDGMVYVYHHPDIQLAVNVALITGRPLLVEGPSGCGKSTLAYNAALSLGRKYYEFVVTNRSESQDLLWSIDNIRRLNDANVNKLQPDQMYIEPGVLWWALDSDSAAQRGAVGVLPEEHWASDPNRGVDGEDSVILIDEIDKADPDFPNGLLVPLGAHQFAVAPAQCTVHATKAPLIVITTNNERQLPSAFLRRCVVLQVPAPDAKTLVEIAIAVDPQRKHDHDLLGEVARSVASFGGEEGVERVCSTAEYIDTVRACYELDIRPGSDEFERLTRITVRGPEREKELGSWG